MSTLALDVDGVLPDPDRGGDGHWTNDLEHQHGLTRPQLRDSLFMRSWDDVVNRRPPIEDALTEALHHIGSSTPVENRPSCWFDADYVPFKAPDAPSHTVSARGPSSSATEQTTAHCDGYSSACSNTIRTPRSSGLSQQTNADRTLLAAGIVRGRRPRTVSDGDPHSDARPAFRDAPRITRVLGDQGWWHRI